MEEEIEVGEYVRTKNGLIGKIKEFIPHYTKGKREGQEVEENFLLMGQEQCKFIESIDYRIPPCYPSDEEWEKIKKYIVKHSKQLIDLIECGDYVNGELITDKWDTRISSIRSNFSEEDIKIIRTKESYMVNCYKVGGEDE